MGKILEVLNRMNTLGITEMEAHWLLGRLAADVPNTLAEALAALERKRATDATAEGRAAA